MSKISKSILLEGNKILAKLDNLETWMSGKTLVVGRKDGSGWGILYDEDWAQLMPLITKIKQEGYRFFLEINEEHAKVRFDDMAIPGNQIVFVKHFGTDIHAVWLAAVEMAKIIIQDR